MVSGDHGTAAEYSPFVPVRVAMLAALVLSTTATHPRAAAQTARPPAEATVPVPADFATLELQVRAYIQPYIDKAKSVPQDADARATLGLVYAANGLWTSARACFAEEVRLEPGDGQAHYYLGIATAELGDLDGAIAIYRNVAVRLPNFAPR